jgi:hypothetical protein
MRFSPIYVRFERLVEFVLDGAHLLLGLEPLSLLVL